jgi:hypothetical protein
VGLRERLGLEETAADDDWYIPVPPPRAWLEPPTRTMGNRLALQPLGEAGYGLRDPDTGESLLVDDPVLEARGAVVTSLEGIAERRDPERIEASRPGSVLQLSPEGRHVTVYDGSGTLDIGYLNEDLSVAVREALRKGADLFALSLWEIDKADGQRTELKVLLVPTHLELVLTVGTTRTIDLTITPNRTA